MELRIELSDGEKRVEIVREDFRFLGMTWLGQHAEIRRACEQAIGAFYAQQMASRDG
jgi:hypothetical protein